MFANENSSFLKMENFMKKLTKIHDDLVKLEGCHKKKKLAHFKITIFEKLYERALKLSILMITIFMILYCYYFYIFWNLLPSIEGTAGGLTFEFTEYKNWSDSNYRREFINIIIFHFYFFMFIWCLIKTIVSDPGSLHKEYKDIYSSLNIILSLYNYFENYQTNNTQNEFNLNNYIKEEYIYVFDDLIDNYNDIINKFYDCLHAYNLLKIPWNLKYIEDGDNSETTENNVSIYSKRKNSGEKELIELSKALKELNSKVIDFFEGNEIYKVFLENTTFHDITEENNRFCKFCLLKKPDRTHHCRTCKTCLRKMDHHCLVLGTCIAAANYKSFFLTLIYSTILLNFSFFTSLKTIFFYTEEFNNTSDSLLYILYVFVLGIITAFLTYFTFFHLRLIIINKTTIEYKEKTSENDDTQKYNRGILKNFQEIFGENYLLWLLPIQSENILDGYAYLINESYVPAKSETKEESKIVISSS